MREEQKRAVEEQMRGRDVLMVAGTGYGKSLAFQLPALLSPSRGVTLVVAPLVALIKDQMRWMAVHGVPAVSLYGKPPARIRKQLLQSVAAADGCLFFVTTKQATSKDAMEALAEADEKGQFDRLVVET